MASLLPWADWQFYVATAVALAGVWLGLRPLLRQRHKPGCSHCKVARRADEALVTLGRRPRS